MKGKLNQKVLMVTNNNFPNGDAGSLRDYSFAKIYTSMGFQVICICNNPEVSEGEYNGVKFYSIYKKKSNVFQKIANFTTYKKRMKETLNLLVDNWEDIELVHLYDIPELGFKYLYHIAMRYKIKIVHDSTEWYSASQFKRGIFDKAYLLKNRLNTKVIKSPIKVIAISSYLERHFKKRGIQVIRIPAILDVKNTNYYNDEKNDKIKMIYAGSPGKKDFLKEFVEAVSLLSKDELKKIEVHFVGVTKDDLISMDSSYANLIDILNDIITFYGKVEREVVLKLYKSMDYSILLRPSGERYAMAGFPTKVAESMASGVPMMCNITSDLSEYLQHKKNAILISGSSTYDVLNALRLVIGLSYEERHNHKLNARATAEKYFDYRNYTPVVKSFILD